MKIEDKVRSCIASEVIVSTDRHRKIFDPKAMMRLRFSIRTHGQMLPGVCDERDGVVHLVAGERRLRACKDEGHPFKYILVEDADPITLQIIELTENLQRENLHWKEEVDAKEALHRLEQEVSGVPEPGIGGGHSMEDTANLLGETKGLVSQDLELSYFAASVPEVANARTKTEAKKIVKRIKEQVERKRALVKAMSLDTDEVPETEEGKPPDPKIELKNKLTYYAKRAKLGKMEERITEFKDLDVVIFDPPWGVEIDKVMKDTGTTQNYDDSLNYYKSMLPYWLSLIYNVMNEDSHLYMFFAIRYHNFVYHTLEEIGFTTNKMPLIWHKLGAHSVRTPNVWPGRCYEPIAYARKGDKNLIVKGRADVITTPMLSHAKKRDHPSAKHPKVYVDLLERSAMPGDKVLDPMSGSGMFGVACEYLNTTKKLDWSMIEIDKAFRDLGLFNLVQGYNTITSSEEEKTPEIPTQKKYDDWAEALTEEKEKRMKGGFETLTPGTQDWKDYWKAHPEEQDKMLAFKAERS